MQHDIYSLGVCLLEIGLWESFVNTDKYKDYFVESGSLKDQYTALAKKQLPKKMGEKYMNIVINCLSCMDKSNEDFGNESEFQDSDGILIGVKYTEKISLLLSDILQDSRTFFYDTTEKHNVQDAYSDNSTTRRSVKDVYVNELVAELLMATSSFRNNSFSMSHVKKAMPGCLKAFSLRLSATGSSHSVHQGVPAFIRNYRHDIVGAFINESLDDSSTKHEYRAGENMALGNKMELRMKHGSKSDNLYARRDIIEDSDEFSEAGSDSNPAHLQIETDEALGAAMPGLQKFRECIVKSYAYEWLLNDLQRH
ncbi:hypothetical protein LTR66_016983, partial [Elasticomyces elasticus]